MTAAPPFLLPYSLRNTGCRGRYELSGRTRIERKAWGLLDAGDDWRKRELLSWMFYAWPRNDTIQCRLANRAYLRLIVTSPLTIPRNKLAVSDKICHAIESWCGDMQLSMVAITKATSQSSRRIGSDATCRFIHPRFVHTRWPMLQCESNAAAVAAEHIVAHASIGETSTRLRGLYTADNRVQRRSLDHRLLRARLRAHLRFLMMVYARARTPEVQPKQSLESKKFGLSLTLAGIRQLSPELGGAPHNLDMIRVGLSRLLFQAGPGEAKWRRNGITDVQVMANRERPGMQANEGRVRGQESRNETQIGCARGTRLRGIAQRPCAAEALP